MNANENANESSVNIKPKNKKNTTQTNWDKYKNIVNVKSNGEDHNTKYEDPNLKPCKYRNRRKKNYHKSENKEKKMENNESVFEVKGPNIDKNTVTKLIAMDCEMVGIGDGTDSMIARVSIVNRYGVCIYDKYVQPTEPVTDYRTAISGIRPCNLENGELFNVVQKEVAEILQGRILIGHALKNDLDVLFLKHPRRHIRDTSRFKPFLKFAGGNTPSLKRLASQLLGIKIQTGEHNSAIDAKVAMQLYLVYRNKWESHHKV